MFDNYTSVPKEAIPESEDNFPRCGVYFLMHDDEVVYVGQSVSIDNRIKQHRKDKTFDYAKAVKVDSKKLLFVESNFINTMKPKYNKTVAHETIISSEDIQVVDKLSEALPKFSADMQRILLDSELPIEFSDNSLLCTLYLGAEDNHLKHLVIVFIEAVCDFLNAYYVQRKGATNIRKIIKYTPTVYSVKLSAVVRAIELVNTEHFRLFNKDLYVMSATVYKLEQIYNKIRFAENQHLGDILEYEEYRD